VKPDVIHRNGSALHIALSSKKDQAPSHTGYRYRTFREIWMCDDWRLLADTHTLIAITRTPLVGEMSTGRLGLLLTRWSNAAWLSGWSLLPSGSRNSFALHVCHSVTTVLQCEPKNITPPQGFLAIFPKFFTLIACSYPRKITNYIQLSLTLTESCHI